jgi:hypothetical protein
MNKEKHSRVCDEMVDASREASCPETLKKESMMKDANVCTLMPTL